MYELLAQAGDVVTQVDDPWRWVGLGYAAVYGGMAAFVAGLVLRIRRARHKLDELP